MVLEIPLAVTAVATAVKDLVEVGQKIYGSFAKVSDNFDSAKRAMEDINGMVHDIEVFYEDHKDALDGMKDFDVALKGLLGKFRNFETSVLPFLPQTGGRKRARLIRNWEAWRNNNKIERSIFDLQSDMVRVMRRYVLNSTLRAEVKLENIHQETSRGLTGITQGLEVLEQVQREVSALRITSASTATHNSYEPSGTTGDEFNRTIIMFAQSTASSSVPILLTPDVITEELMTTAYIKLQISRIAMTVEGLSELPLFSTTCGVSPRITRYSIEQHELSPLLKHKSMAIVNLRHHVVRQVTYIRDLFDNERVHTISMFDGARLLNELATGLKVLGMGHESILAGNWAIVLARMLVQASSGHHWEAGLRADLAMYLVNQMSCYRDSGHEIQKLAIIEEAYAIIQDLQREYCGDTDSHFQILYGNILLDYAELSDEPYSTQMTVEAIQVFESTLHTQSFTRLNSDNTIEWVVQPSLSFLRDLFSSTLPVAAITSYARALQHLGAYLSANGSPERAVELMHLSLAVRREMVSVYGAEHSANLANTLSSLVQSQVSSCIPTEELVSIADEGIRHLTLLANKNPRYYARDLVSIMWTKASALQRLHRDTEAIAAWEEATSLAAEVVEDAQLCARALENASNHFWYLKRHDEAVNTRKRAMTMYQDKPEIEAETHFYLSFDLQQLRRYTEAAQAASTSVRLYQQLVMSNPGTWLGNLTEGLVNLAHCLVASGDYSRGLIALKEFESLIDNSLNTNPESLATIPECLTALHTYTLIGDFLPKEEDSLQVNSIGCQNLRRLSEIYPENEEVTRCLLHTEICFAHNMIRVGQLQNAAQYIDRWVNVWSGKPVGIRGPELASSISAMLLSKACLLYMQGYSEEALLVTQQAYDIANRAGYRSQCHDSVMIGSMIIEAEILMDLGSCEKALKSAEEALQLSQKNRRETNLGDHLRSLLAVSLNSPDYKYVLETVRKGCDILMSSEGTKYWQDSEHVSSISPAFFSVLAFAEANLGRHSAALESAHRAVNMSQDIGNMKLYVSATTAEHSYAQTRGYLADILLAFGEISQALEICQDRRVYFLERVKRRPGEYRNLAPILRMLGILCCSEGRHDEGVTAAQELSDIVKMLGNAFPSLQMQVKRRLRRQVEVPILEALNDMSQKLECGHQAGIASLFEGVEDG